jgi:sec-independent protein translocase protein TatA
MELFTPGHLIVLAIVALVLFFGWKQLPDMSRSLGRSLRIFKTEIKGMTQDDNERAEAADKAEEKPRALPPAQVVPNPPAPVAPNDAAPGVPNDGAKARPRPTPNGARSDSPHSNAQ